MTKLEKTINTLRRTKADIVRLYGEDAIKGKQLFIKREDAHTFARDMFLDLDENGEIPGEIHITTGNQKLNAIPSIAFNPFLTCSGEKCLAFCYGTNQKFLSFFKFFYEIENTFFMMKYPDIFAKRFNAYISLYQPRYFRFFENGDFVNVANVALFNEIAKNNPGTSFLCMTKKSVMVNTYLKSTGGKYAKNLVLRFSDVDIENVKINLENPYGVPLTCVVDKGVKSGRDSVLCPGTATGCIKCLKCWKCAKKVLFELHR